MTNNPIKNTAFQYRTTIYEYILKAPIFKELSWLKGESMERRGKKGHQHDENGDEDKEKNKEVSHVLDIPADDRLDENAGAVE